MNKLSVIVLCGGKGVRLLPLTKYTPKPLVKIKGKPILNYIIKHLIKNNILDITFAVGYKSYKIKKFINEFKIPKKINYRIIDSGNVDIIKRIKDSTKNIQKDILVIYGDTFTNISLKKLYSFHLKNKSPATVVSYPFKTSFGLFNLNSNNKITRFREKPILEEYINIGYFIFRKQLFEKFEKYEKFEKFIQYLINSHKINSYKFSGLHLTFNTIGELIETEEKLKFNE